MTKVKTPCHSVSFNGDPRVTGGRASGDLTWFVLTRSEWDKDQQNLEGDSSMSAYLSTWESGQGARWDFHGHKHLDCVDYVVKPLLIAPQIRAEFWCRDEARDSPVPRSVALLVAEAMVPCHIFPASLMWSPRFTHHIMHPRGSCRAVSLGFSMIASCRSYGRWGFSSWLSMSFSFPSSMRQSAQLAMLQSRYATWHQ